MPQTGLGLALRTLRERRVLSLRELGVLTEIDHAYIHRLESGEKVSPSAELVSKLLRVLKADEREAVVIRWLAEHSDADPALVEYILANPTVTAEVAMAAAGIRHRGTARPDPATLIARVQKAFNED